MFDKNGNKVNAMTVSFDKLLERFAGRTLEEASYELTERQYRYLEKARYVRARLCSALETPEELQKVKAELIDEIMLPIDKGGLNLSDKSAFRLIGLVMKNLGKAAEIPKEVARAILIKRNMEARRLAMEKEDLAAMNSADNVWLKLFRLDQPDDPEVNPDTIYIPNVLGTVHYADVMPGAKRYENVLEPVAKAAQLARSGIIDLKEGADYEFVTNDVPAFDQAVQVQTTEEDPDYTNKPV